jgi:hypothetical protein
LAARDDDPRLRLPRLAGASLRLIASTSPGISLRSSRCRAGPELHCPLPSQAVARTARTVDGYQRAPPCAVLTRSRFRPAAIPARVEPRSRSRRMRHAPVSAVDSEPTCPAQRCERFGLPLSPSMDRYQRRKNRACRSRPCLRSSACGPTCYGRILGLCRGRWSSSDTCGRSRVGVLSTGPGLFRECSYR